MYILKSFSILCFYILIYSLSSVLFIKMFANIKFIISGTFYYFKEITPRFKVNII